MKVSKLLLIAVFTFSISAFAEMKLGYINSETIFQKYKGTNDAQAKFDKEAAKIQQEATNKKKEIEDLKTQLEKQSLLLSAERKKELETKITAKAAEFESYVAQYYGRDGELIKRNADLTKPIIDKINKIIDKISQDENFDIIFDARMGGIVYGRQKLDLTDRVIEILNKGN